MSTNYRKLALKRILAEGDVQTLLSAKEAYFKDVKSRKIYSWIMKHYNNHKKLPTTELLQATIKAQLGERGEIYTAYLESLEPVVVAGITSEEVLEGLITEVSVHNVDESIKQLVEAAENKDLAAIRNLSQDISKAASLDIDVLPVSITDIDIVTEQTKTLEPFMPTMSNKGFAFAGVNLVSAASGGGKSVFALNQAIYSYEKHNADILYLNIEIPAQDQLLRTMSHIQKIPFDSVYNVDLKPTELTRLNKAKNEFFSKPPKFKMVNTALDEETLVNLILSEIPTGLDLVVLDYIQLVENSNDYVKSWEFLQKLVKRLHHLALKHQIVILTPIQINASDVDVDLNTIDITTRGSRELEFTSTTWLHIHQEPDEVEENACRIFTVKARNAKKHTYIAKTEFEVMTFTDTGIVL